MADGTYEANNTRTIYGTGAGEMLNPLPDDAYPAESQPISLANDRDAIPHNLIAHPLLILCPPLGRWLHDRTEPTVPRLRERCRIARAAVIGAATADGWPRFHLLRWWR